MAMSDDADISDVKQEALLAAEIARVRAAAEPEPGQPGECAYCGEESPRLVRGACAPCRDRRGLK